MKLLLLFALLLGSCDLLCAQYSNVETKDQRDQRMRWWREARFGMFIHWGVYAVPAGEYRGKRSEHAGEWIMEWANIPTRRLRGVCRAVQSNQV